MSWFFCTVVIILLKSRSSQPNATIPCRFEKLIPGNEDVVVREGCGINLRYKCPMREASLRAATSRTAYCLRTDDVIDYQNSPIKPSKSRTDTFSVDLTDAKRQDEGEYCCGVGETDIGRLCFNVYVLALPKPILSLEESCPASKEEGDEREGNRGSCWLVFACTIRWNDSLSLDSSDICSAVRLERDGNDQGFLFQVPQTHNDGTTTWRFKSEPLPGMYSCGCEMSPNSFCNVNKTHSPSFLFPEKDEGRRDHTTIAIVVSASTLLYIVAVLGACLFACYKRKHQQRSSTNTDIPTFPSAGHLVFVEDPRQAYDDDAQPAPSEQFYDDDTQPAPSDAVETEL